MAALAMRFRLQLLLVLLVGTTAHAHAGIIFVGASCTIAQAIESANAANGIVAANIGSATTNGGSCAGATSGANTIVLASATTYTFTQADNWWYGPNALPPIASTIKIEGQGAVLQASHSGDPTPATADAFRFFYVPGGGFGGPLAGMLTLRDLTLQGGYAKGGDAGIAGGGAGMGGAIFNQGGLVLEEVLLLGNTARGGASGVAFDPSVGGGGIGQDGAPASGGGFGGSLGSSYGGTGGLPNAGLGGGGGGGGGFSLNGDPAGSDLATSRNGGAGAEPTLPLGGGGGTGSPAGAQPGALGAGGGGGAGPSGSGILLTGGGGGAFGNGGISTAGGGGGGGGIGGGGGGGGSFGGGGGAGFGGGGGFGSGEGGEGGFGGGGGTGIPGQFESGAPGGFGGGDGTISWGGNGAGMGGAIFNFFGSVRLLNVTATGNIAAAGLLECQCTQASGLGAVLFNLDGLVTIDFSTLAYNNVVGTNYRNTYYGPGDGTVYSLAYGQNENATLTINNSIVYGTNGADGASSNDVINNSAGSVATLTYLGSNLIGASDNFGMIGPGNTPPSSADPLLGVLANNGGPTRTLLPAPGSVAFNGAATCTDANNLPVLIDGRHIDRPQGDAGLCDIGAVELEVHLCYVNSSANPGGNGTSWAQAFADLQYALAADCLEIWVAKGTYKPATVDRTVTFFIRPGLGAYGGFNGSETQLSQRDPRRNRTILSGDINVANDTSDNSHHVVTLDATMGPAAIPRHTLLDGFVITAGNANGVSAPANCGGGLLCNGSGSTCNPTLSNLYFVGNTTSGFGGAVCNYANGNGHPIPGTSSPLITNSSFVDNSSANDGGAIGNIGLVGGDASPALINDTFTRNSAVGGGAMYNSSAFGGNSSPTLSNLTFTANTATFGGGGAVLMFNCSTNGIPPIVTNVILWGDADSSGFGTATSEFRIECNTPSAQPVFTNTIIQGFSAGDPLLGKLQYNGGFTPTVMIGGASPAINGGDGGLCPATDQRGVARPQGPGCDIGAVERKSVEDVIFNDGFGTL